MNLFLSLVDALICYIHHVSGLKQGPKKQYFNYEVQTEDSMVPGICFSPLKKKQFHTNEEKKSPVKLSNFKLNDKFGPLKIVVDQSTDVAVIDQPINFMPIAETSASDLVKISTIQKDSPGQLINVRAKVAKALPSKVVALDNGSKLTKQDVILQDDTSSIRLVLWGSLAGSVTEGETYVFHHVKVRKDKFSEVYINSVKTGNTKIEHSDAFKEKLAEIETTLTTSIVNLNATILGVSNFTKCPACRDCNKKVSVTKNGKMAKCNFCNLLQKTETCRNNYYLKLFLADERNPSETVDLSVFHHRAKKLEAVVQHCMTPSMKMKSWKISCHWKGQE